MSHIRQRWSSASLFWRVFGLNASILVIAGLTLALTPATVSDPVESRQIAVLAGGVAVLLAADLLLLRRALRPLERLVDDMRAVDVLKPGLRMPTEGPGQELMTLSIAFNDMITRLEDERQVAATARFSAIDEERSRIARELHDQVGQDLTALLMQLDRLPRAGDAQPVDDARELTREILETVRDIVYQLRPEAIDELGLGGALEAMCQRVGAMTGVSIRAQVHDELPSFSIAAETTIYRIAQEAVTNAVRHAGAANVSVSLQMAGDGAVLTVHDNGPAVDPITDGGGLRGIRERALTISATVELDSSPGHGTVLRLAVPAGS